jgi:hypothetical protein
MGWQAVPRARCIELGLVGEDEASGPMSGELTPDERHVNEAWDRLPPDVREQVRRELAQSPEQELLRREAEAHQAAMDARVREGIERREEIREAGRRMLEGLMT